MNKLDTIPMLTVSLIAKGNNRRKFFNFLLRQREAHREIERVRQGLKETQKEIQRETNTQGVRYRDNLREKRDRTGDTERLREAGRDREMHFLFDNCILTTEKLYVFQL